MYTTHFHCRAHTISLDLVHGILAVANRKAVQEAADSQNKKTRLERRLAVVALAAEYGLSS